MKSRFTVEETVTKYLQDLKNHFKSKEDDMLRDMARVLSEHIVELAPKDTWTLAESGLEEDDWVIQPTLTGTALDIIYSGLGNTQSWVEFSNDQLKNHPPDRDYAYFQETGQDKIADSKYAKHKHFILMSTRRSDTRHQINNIASQYLQSIMNLE